MYFSQLHLIKNYRSKNFKIYMDLPKSIFSNLYFFFITLIYKKVVIHLKKRDPSIFDKLKYFFKNKLIYIYEGEGDPLIEIDYLEKNHFKKNFYSKIISDLKNQYVNQENIFKNSDYIIFGYQNMKSELIDRYPEIDLGKKILLLPMSFKKNYIKFDILLRNKTRSKYKIDKKLVFIYTGNAFYSWQNLYRSLEIFKLIKSKINKESFIILLIKDSDHNIALEFLNKLKIKSLPIYLRV